MQDINQNFMSIVHSSTLSLEARDRWQCAVAMLMFSTRFQIAVPESEKLSR